MYPDNLSSAGNATSYEVIELDQSDDEGGEYMPDVSAFLAPMNDMTEDSPQDPYGQPDMPEETSEDTKPDVSVRVTRNGEAKKEAQQQQSSNQTPKLRVNKSLQRTSSPDSPRSSRSSPLLTPMKTESSNGGGGGADVTKNGDIKIVSNGSSSMLSEVTIRPLVTEQKSNTRRPSGGPAADRLVYNAASPTPTPTLSTSTTDPIELYCLSLVDCLRAMPRSERERVKFEFSKILKDARYTNQS